MLVIFTSQDIAINAPVSNLHHLTVRWDLFHNVSSVCWTNRCISKCHCLLLRPWSLFSRLKCKVYAIMFFVNVFFASAFSQNRADKKRLNIIIVAEGAIDCHNKAITPDYIKEVSMRSPNNSSCSLLVSLKVVSSRLSWNLFLYLFYWNFSFFSSCHMTFRHFNACELSLHICMFFGAR